MSVLLRATLQPNILNNPKEWPQKFGEYLLTIFKDFMKKNKNYLYLGIILVFYFISRLVNLNSLPVFGDEAIYVRWAQIIKSVDTLRFIPLTDGKQPLFMWLNAATLKFIVDPLIAGRIISVFSIDLRPPVTVLITNSLFLFV